jgi:acyl phosphate:glycerol-3-phosphate acyltransferase
MNFFIIIIGILAYLIGAIPTGYLIAQLKGINDIRMHGSGNIGATNVSRLLGLHYFFLVFLLDAGKAFFFIHAITPYCNNYYLYFFAALLLFGNGCSLFLHGSGGKGVATLTGLLSALHPITTAILFCAWLLIFIITHTVGIASLCAITILPIGAYVTHNTAFLLFSFFASLWIIRAHWPNLQAYWTYR